MTHLVCPLVWHWSSVLLKRKYDCSILSFMLKVLVKSLFYMINLNMFSEINQWCIFYIQKSKWDSSKIIHRNISKIFMGKNGRLGLNMGQTYPEIEMHLVHTVSIHYSKTGKLWCVLLSGMVRHQPAAVRPLELCITPTHSMPSRPPIRRLYWRKRPRR